MALTKPSYTVNNVQNLDNIVKGQPTLVKETIDKTGADTKTYLEGLCDEVDVVTASLQEQITTNAEDIADLQSQSGSNVKLSGNQTIDGIKTFTSNPVIPYSSSDSNAATVKYVNDVASSLVAGQITPGAITDNMLNSAIKVGNLPSLTTSVKTSVVGAINELDGILDQAVIDIATKANSSSLTATNNSIINLKRKIRTGVI